MPPQATAAAGRTLGRAAAHTALATALEECRPLLTAARGALRVFPADPPADTSADPSPGASAGASGEAAAGAFADAPPGASAGPPPGPDAVPRVNRALRELGAQLGVPVPEFVWPAPERPTSLEVALSNYCATEPGLWQALAADPADGTRADDTRADGPRPADGAALAAPAPRAAGPAHRTVRAPGLPPFSTWSQGAGDEAIVIVPPCGVPASLFRPWQDALTTGAAGTGRRVLTYENPHLFDGWDQLPFPSGDFAEEVDLVGALLREHGVDRAHLVGVCGGAPVALAAAADAEHAPRIASLTVCHPDLNFGRDVPRSPFQKQFQGFLSEAASSPDRAQGILDLFLDPNMLYGVPARLAPYVLYPYGDPALFHRYALLNHSLMAYDANAAAEHYAGPLLIVTSRTDRMTHPASAHHLHRAVPGSVLSERDTGSHHDILLPTRQLFDEIEEFTTPGGRA